MTTTTALEKLNNARQVYKERKAEEKQIMNDWCVAYRQVIDREERNGRTNEEANRIAEAEVSNTWSKKWNEAHQRTAATEGLITRYCNILTANGDHKLIYA